MLAVQILMVGLVAHITIKENFEVYAQKADDQGVMEQP